MTEAKRDPRIDPRPGDCVRSVQVTYVGAETVTYLCPANGEQEEWCVSLKSWRKWAKNAEVIHALWMGDGATQIINEEIGRLEKERDV